MDELYSMVEKLAAILKSRSQLLATAESCTGGWVAKMCTDLPGSSRWFDRGFVTYTNEAKQEMLGVSKDALEQHGAVSEAVVRAMASGAIQRSHAHWSLSISGIAGPGGGSAEKPVGTVWIGWASSSGLLQAKVYHFEGGREDVRRQAVAAAIKGLLNVLDAS